MFCKLSGKSQKINKKQELKRSVFLNLRQQLTDIKANNPFLLLTSLSKPKKP